MAGNRWKIGICAKIIPKHYSDGIQLTSSIKSTSVTKYPIDWQKKRKQQQHLLFMMEFYSLLDSSLRIVRILSRDGQFKRERFS